MTNEQANVEWARATEEGDSQRLRELRRLEENGSLRDADPKYAEGPDGAQSGGESSLRERAQRAARMAQAGGNDAIQESLEAVAEAQDPAQELDDQQTILRATLGEDQAQALDALRDG